MVRAPCAARLVDLCADAGRLRTDRQSACLRRAAAVGEVAALLTAAIRSGVKLLTFEAGIRHLLATEAERERHLTVMA